MPKFVIEREVSGAGQLSPSDLREAAKKSREVLGELGPDITWLESYITDDKIYCVYVAASEEIVREHARCTGMPADRISAVARVLDVSFAE